MKNGMITSLAMALLIAVGTAHAAESKKETAAAQTGEQKIGYVDLQRAIQGTTTGKKAKADLEAEFNKKQKEIQKKEADLKKMQEDLEKKKLALTEEVLAKKQAELQQEMGAYRQFVGDSQMNIQKRERELTGPILQKLEKIIAKLAEDGGYTMILEKGGQGVLWAKKDVDLTDQVVSAYEKSK
jgi:outer membrane protein